MTTNNSSKEEPNGTDHVKNDPVPTQSLDITKEITLDVTELKYVVVPLPKMVNDIFTVPEGKIRVIPLKTSDRKLLHQYLDTFPKPFGKTSLKSSHLHGDRTHTFIKCYSCDYKKVLINNYHYGCMENNKDEYRSGTCPKCDAHITFEPNYDNWDDVKCVHGNNLLAYGNYFRHHTSPPHATTGVVSIDMITKILNNSRVYELPIPTTALNKRHLATYIDTMIPDLY